jgi:hypothetical protein
MTKQTSCIISLKVSESNDDIVLPQSFTRLMCSGEACWSGMMEMTTCSCAALRKMICVASRVQRPLSRGSGFLINPSSTLLFPEDWSPTTTICGRDTSSPTPQAKRLSIFWSISGEAKPCCSGVWEHITFGNCNEANVVRSDKKKRQTRR